MAETPYIKLSRRLVSSGMLAHLGAKGKAAALWLFLAVEQDEHGIVKATYEQMMQGTGIKSSATIAGLIDSLNTCGLIRRLDPDPDHGTGRYELLGDWTRYKQPGAPEGTLKTEVTGDDTLETEVSLISVVDPDSETPESQENQESVLSDESTTTTLRDTSKTEVPLDPRLQKLELPVSEVQLRAWVNEYGLETVVEKARWYDFKRLRGGADTVGWLLAALRDRYTDPPRGFNENVYLTDEERGWRYVSGKYKDEIEY